MIIGIYYSVTLLTRAVEHFNCRFLEVDRAEVRIIRNVHFRVICCTIRCDRTFILIASRIKKNVYRERNCMPWTETPRVSRGTFSEYNNSITDRTITYRNLF